MDSQGCHFLQNMVSFVIYFKVMEFKEIAIPANDELTIFMILIWKFSKISQDFSWVLTNFQNLKLFIFFLSVTLSVFIMHFNF